MPSMIALLHRAWRCRDRESRKAGCQDAMYPRVAVVTTPSERKPRRRFLHMSMIAPRLARQARLLDAGEIERPITIRNAS